MMQITLEDKQALDYLNTIRDNENMSVRIENTIKWLTEVDFMYNDDKYLLLRLLGLTEDEIGAIKFEEEQKKQKKQEELKKYQEEQKGDNE